MKKKYSSIKSKLKIEITKNSNNDLANFTHYLQNIEKIATALGVSVKVFFNDGSFDEKKEL